MHIHTQVHNINAYLCIAGNGIILCILFCFFFSTHIYFMAIFRVWSYKSSLLFLVDGCIILHYMDIMDIMDGTNFSATDSYLDHF